jgi:hypothetical protein
MEKKFEITKFEELESSNEMVKGGFSTAYAGSAKADAKIKANGVAGTCNITTNNCYGGNCAAGCGSGSSTTA